MGVVAMTCAICGTENPNGSQVCANCGEASWVLENGYAHAPDPEPAKPRVKPEPEQEPQQQLVISGSGSATTGAPKRKGRRRG